MNLLKIFIFSLSNGLSCLESGVFGFPGVPAFDPLFPFFRVSAFSGVLRASVYFTKGEC